MRGRCYLNFFPEKGKGVIRKGGGGVKCIWEKGGHKKRIYDISMKHSFEGYSGTIMLKQN